MENTKLKPRADYLRQLVSFQDTEPVKIVTGIRRCGKSSLLQLMIRHLLESGIPEGRIIRMNFESMRFMDMTFKDIYSYVKEQIPEGQRVYLFFDEIQQIPSWEKAINAMRVDFDCDIYVTGSNACLLSSEYATVLSGRSIEIRMLPLSFREFLEFHGYSLHKERGMGGDAEWNIAASDGRSYTPVQALDAYHKYGGMPGLTDVGLETDKALTLLDGIFSTVIMRDILERERRRGERQITTPELLRRISLFLADNVGNPVSAASIANTIGNGKLFETSRGKTSPHTIQAYVSALTEAYLFYPVKRFDIRGKEFLRTLGKYYIVDPGLRNYLLGFRDRDRGHVLENTVYFELLRRGYDVSVGKNGDKEIDFIAVKDDEKRYYQVTETLNEESVREREFAPLETIRDNHPKIVLTLHGIPGTLENGIRVQNIADFLLNPA